MHTSASDGRLTPFQVAKLAIQLGLDLIAITDHDTTGGIAEAASASQGKLTVIPGIELSAEDESGDVHTLGYFITAEDTAFQQTLARFRDDRYHRGYKIVQKLGELGMPIDWERVKEIANGGSVGRPHIARALVEAGYVESVKQAFDLYIHNEGPAYVARKRMTPEEAIALIHSAGGAAVLAHPGLLSDPLAMIERLVPAGLDGIEVVHPKNSETVRLNARGLAQKYHLVMTGGSDFHGVDGDTARMLGSVNPPEGCVYELRERAKAYAKQT